MAEPLRPPEKFLQIHRSKATRAGQELARMLEEIGWPTITDYELFLLVQALYKSKKKLRLRHEVANLDDFRRLRRQLRHINILGSDPSYSAHAHRILVNSDRAAEDVCCTIDPFCYVSHLSALQRYGLTDRRPEALILTAPAPKIGRVLVVEKMKRDHGTDVSSRLDEIVPLHLVHHPKRVRKRPIEEFRTNYLGECTGMRGSFTRIATIGQTFLDMLDEPELCGGMAHVIDVWQEHAQIYLDDIIPVIDRARTAITKVRAGYILTNILNCDDDRVLAWKKFAMRGGSRRLDPSKPYMPTYSEDWMISLNA